MVLDHRLGAGMQISRARVIAEPGPQPEHLLERRRGQRPHVRPARGEAGEIGRDRLHGGLLQHDLGEPHAIRDRASRRRHPPRQRAAMAVVPGEQVAAGSGRSRLSLAASPRVLLRAGADGAQLPSSAPCGLLRSCLDRCDRAVAREQARQILSAPARRTFCTRRLGECFRQAGLSPRPSWSPAGPRSWARRSPPIRSRRRSSWPRAAVGRQPEPGILVLRVEGPTAARNSAPLRRRCSSASIASSAGRRSAGCGCGRPRSPARSEASRPRSTAKRRRA